jgi:hypothetical protein
MEFLCQNPDFPTKKPPRSGFLIVFCIVLYCIVFPASFPSKGEGIGFWETLGTAKAVRVNNFSAEKYVCSPKPEASAL